MKTKIFFLSLFLHLICLNGHTQAYNPLVLENAQWIVIQDDDATPWIDAQVGWLIRGDTLIDDIAYKKLFRRVFEEPYSNVITNQWLYGFLREDTANQIVYVIESSGLGCDSVGQEYLLFDFSYEVGDTSQMCIHSGLMGTTYVEDITYDFLYGIDRKVLQFNGGSAWFIEGVGHELGLLESASFPLSGGMETILQGYCIGTDEECDVVYVKIDEDEDEDADTPHYQVYPNPFSDHFYIKDISDLDEDFIFAVYDVLGKEIVSGEMQANRETLVNLKEPGLYFLKIRRQDEIPSCYKVVNR